MPVFNMPVFFMLDSPLSLIAPPCHAVCVCGGLPPVMGGSVPCALVAHLSWGPTPNAAAVPSHLSPTGGAGECHFKFVCLLLVVSKGHVLPPILEQVGAIFSSSLSQINSCEHLICAGQQDL